MSIYQRKIAEKLRGAVTGTAYIALFLIIISALPAQSEEIWNCEETALYSIYEDISRTESKATSNPKTLKWIDADTIGFESLSLKRIDPNSDTYFNESSGSSLIINQAERPHLVVLTQPQVWMNMFGNLRVRFYRCTE